MEVLLALYVVVRVVADFLCRGYSDAQNYAFYMLSALIGPYLLGPLPDRQPAHGHRDRAHVRADVPAVLPAVPVRGEVLGQPDLQALSPLFPECGQRAVDPLGHRAHRGHVRAPDPRLHHDHRGLPAAPLAVLARRVGPAADRGCSACSSVDARHPDRLQAPDLDRAGRDGADDDLAGSLDRRLRRRGARRGRQLRQPQALAGRSSSCRCCSRPSPASSRWTPTSRRRKARSSPARRRRCSTAR